MRKEEKYRELILLQEDSGLTVKGFCQDQGIAPATYYYWRKKFKDERKGNGFVPLLIKPAGALAGSRNSRNPGLQAMFPDHAGSGPVIMELAYPNGVVLRLKNTPGLSDLKALIHLGE
ncbi:MAG: hypothetical protein K9H64_22065 [Bacteroidales bacterium]|nr:hypothetical protein [Bacteroidales bacterium]MCF8458715.1 hypothetical protein [Bacteroidales bacterium]